jgi:hypothetical protein
VNCIGFPLIELKTSQLELVPATQLHQNHRKSDRRCCMPASLIVLVVMTVVVAVLGVYRWVVTRNEDDSLHIGDSSAPMIVNQRQIEHTLTQVDRLGIGLTVVTALYGVGLLAIYLYSGLMAHGLS